MVGRCMGSVSGAKEVFGESEAKGECQSKKLPWGSASNLGSNQPTFRVVSAQVRVIKVRSSLGVADLFLLLIPGNLVRRAVAEEVAAPLSAKTPRRRPVPSPEGWS